MYNLLISILSGVLIYLGFYYLWLGVTLQAALPAIFVVAGLYFYLSRRTWKLVEEEIKSSMKLLEPLSQRPDLAQKPEQRNAIVDETIKKLQLTYRYTKWQFMIKSQLNAQLGIILYSVKQDTSAAMPYLEKSFKRNWIAQAMLAIILMKKHKPERMEDVFELAVRVNKKQDLLWNLYAYCLQKIKKRDKAIEVLGRARKILPSNNHLIENLIALQNKKKMKMKMYGEQWYQFQLEKPKAQRTKNARFSRR